MNYRMRDMIPDENRISLDAFRERPDRLRQAVELVGKITAWAHFRGLRSPSRIASRRLVDWSEGPASAAILASAIRFAEQTVQQYNSFISFGIKRVRRQLADRAKSGR
jgi:hypothetical protein